MDRLDEQTLLKEYLLGKLSDEAARSSIEERLLADDQYAAHIRTVENDLIEEFLDSDLSAKDSDDFTRFFLAPPERRRQLRLTQHLRRLSTQTASKDPRRQRSLTPGFYSWAWLRFACAAVVLLIAAFAIWRVVIYRSDTDKGIEQLQAAYRDQRPLESRMAEFREYTPYSETRGAGSTASDKAALERAEKYLLEASVDPNNADAHRSRAVYFAATHDLERATREIETALKVSPNDARVQSDAGAVYYEASKNAGDSAKQLKLLDTSLFHLQRAIELDPKLLEPRFNRALCLEALTNVEQAKSAWNEYLSLDPDSRWSAEAKHHLQLLEQSAQTDRSADQLESDFLAAFHSGDRAAAEKIIGETREAVREKYVPQRLAMSAATAEPDGRAEFVKALSYSGEIESALRSDPYAADVAHFYASLDDAKFVLVRNAQQLVRKGYADCTANNYDDCLVSFEAARDQFKRAGDEPEARLAEYFVGYGQLNKEHHTEALTTINAVAQYARSHSYRWLEMTATHWVGGCLGALNKNTEALSAYQRALTMARETSDSYATDRNLISIAELESDSRQDSDALRYTFDALQLSSSPSTSMRQRYRDLAAALPILSRAGLHHAAVFLGREAIAVADLEKDATWMAQARGFTAVAFEEAGDFETAKALLNESRSTAESIENEATRQKNIAFAELRSGDVEYAAGDYAAAARSYSEAAAIYDSGVEIPVNSEQAHVGKLRSDLALGKTEELEAQIPVTIQLTEKRRLGIRDESQQMGFFDSRINVYDIAAVFELSRGNAEAAYNYAETSSSRSLLDHMLSGLDRVDSGNGEQLLLHGNANPLKLDQIRGQVPIDAQVIQYSVFSDKLVIWLISQNEFSYFSQPISAKDLAKKVNAYASLVSQPNSNPEEEQAGARELYDLLIAPVRERLRPDGEVCIVPSRVLFEIPFAALLTPDGERLIKKFSIIYSPSANVFVSATTLAGQKTIPVSDESILAVGDPAFDHNRHPGLPSLSDAAVESQRVSKIYGAKSRALVGRSAMKSTFLNNVDTADIVHFAGHYVAQTSSPMSSYLLFASSGDAVGSDELTDLELAAVSFKHTRLVVLAACDSGAESWYEGEGMIGAARSLLAAGVPLVVASQWAVDSRATSELMIRFHQNRHFQHQPTAAALRDAQLAMIDDQRLGYASPYYWAGFGVFGGAANF